MLKTLLLSLTLLFSSCAYMNIKTPLDTDVSNTVLGDKQGSAKTHSIMWLVSWGDGGTAAAAKDGNIKNITHLDVRYYTILFGLYAERETIAYGE